MLNLFAPSRRTETVPIFPLNAVLYPGAALPLRIFEVRYIDMVRDRLKGDKPFGVCLIREGAEVGAPAVPETVGCLARIAECDVEQPPVLKVRAEGLERFRIVSTATTPQGLIVGEVERFAPEPAAPDAPGLAPCAQFLQKAIAGIGVARFVEPLRFEDASWVGFRLAEILPLRGDVKQKLLELTDATLRVAILEKFLRQQRLI
jgi:uncharacterized protein